MLVTEVRMKLWGSKSVCMLDVLDLDSGPWGFKTSQILLYRTPCLLMLSVFKFYREPVRNPIERFCLRGQIVKWVISEWHCPGNHRDQSHGCSHMLSECLRSNFVWISRVAKTNVNEVSKMFLETFYIQVPLKCIFDTFFQSDLQMKESLIN